MGGRKQDPLLSLQHSIERAGQQVSAAFKPVLPFLLQAAVSMGAYTAGLAGVQAAGMALRVSCATPVAGPVGGLLGVGLASAMAGQAALKCRQYQRDGRLPRGVGDLWKGVRREDLLVDALLGIALFKAMGGRFRSVMPSDLSRVGAIARESLPAASVEYASEANRRELQRLFRRDGCHHCGTRRGKAHGDHMPPNKHVQQHIAAAKRSVFRLPFVRQVASGLGIPTGPPRQRYYPQCVACSQLQSSAIRNDKRVLVFHEVLHRGGKGSGWHYAGVVLGLRHTHTGGGGPFGSGPSGGTRQRRI